MSEDKLFKDENVWEDKVLRGQIIQRTNCLKDKLSEDKLSENKFLKDKMSGRQIVHRTKCPEDKLFEDENGWENKVFRGQLTMPEDKIFKSQNVLGQILQRTKHPENKY